MARKEKETLAETVRRFLSGQFIKVTIIRSNIIVLSCGEVILVEVNVRNSIPQLTVSSYGGYPIKILQILLDGRETIEETSNKLMLRSGNDSYVFEHQGEFRG